MESRHVKAHNNIGKFTSCNAGGAWFSENTIILGKNAQGKSTLTAILRSLQTGNNDILIGRKTLNANGSKRVEIIFGDNSVNTPYIFENKSWKKKYPEIVIFDTKFISENIFEGESITHECQQKLNAIIIGKEGRDLKKEINQLQEECDKLTRTKKEILERYRKTFPNYPIKQFLSLPEDKLIKEKIQKKNKEIEFEKNKENTGRKIDTHINTISAIDFSVKEILSKTFESKQDEITEHIKNNFNTDTNAENFLKGGLSYLKESKDESSNRNCVFCGQELGKGAEALLLRYAEHFKGGYEQLLAQVQIAIKKSKGVNIETILTKIDLELNSLGIDTGFNNDKIGELVGAWKSFCAELEKKSDLNYNIDFTDFDLVQHSINDIRKRLEIFKKEKIDSTSNKNHSELKNEKTLLETNDKRFENDWVEFCSKYNDVIGRFDIAKGLRENKREELVNYSTKIFKTHKKKINYFFKEMGADFEVYDFEPLKKIKGKDERIFGIKFFGEHKVSINTTNDASPHFNNTLSESDKRLLAFAFFLSLLSNDKKLDKKILVFDDPMSSFDIERRWKTIHLITDIECTFKDENGTVKSLYPKQKIILTHEVKFVKDLKKSLSDARTLKIGKCSRSSHSSTLEYCDLQKEFPDDEIIAKLESLKSILDSGSFDNDFFADCRIVLENIFKRKYYFTLKSAIDQNRSVGAFITELSNAGINDYGKTHNNKIKRVLDINTQLHDNTTTFSDGDKKDILKEFFDCLELI